MPPPKTSYDSSLFWFRRDLRDEDNAGLHYALASSRRVYCVFVFDREILDALPSRQDRRVEFIHDCVGELRAALRARGGELIAIHGRSREEIPALASRLGVTAVFANEDYEPAAVSRDAAVEQALAAAGRRLHLAKDHAIFARDEVLTQAGGHFAVFTPYKRAWLVKVDDFYLKAYPVARYAPRLARPRFTTIPPTLGKMGFEPSPGTDDFAPPGMSGARRLFADFEARMSHYASARDFPAVQGVSRLSVHNRFGTISIRQLARAARQAPGDGAATWLSELIWRDFYFQILWHHPHAATGAYRREYDAIHWPGTEEHHAAWCEARTGFPIVDAAMRQINATGWMHNRLRMIVASFLVKDLLLDWRRGEKYFADHLIDFDLAANNGGWQWAASTGCDAQPYFRIFNPVSQSERFDPEGRFIRRFLPELAHVPGRFIHAPWTMGLFEQQACGCVIGRDYPAPIVDHAAQRVRALALFKAARSP
ncbi:MAG: deoxyribodipyrimidine photo-lyase [Betaproteobacteria bacterium]|nr:deoxyribodipyrimidine photo-lyase [Betaproteobacteria bacterium]